MKIKVEIAQSVKLDYTVEYRVTVTGLNDTPNCGLGKTPGKALDQALLDAFLEHRLGPLVSR
jgi:hypothetical protein